MHSDNAGVKDTYISQQKIRAVFRTIRTVSTGLKYSTVPDYCIYNNGLNPTQELL